MATEAAPFSLQRAVQESSSNHRSCNCRSRQHPDDSRLAMERTHYPRLSAWCLLQYSPLSLSLSIALYTITFCFVCHPESSARIFSPLQRTSCYVKNGACVSWPACESFTKLRTWSFSTKMGNVFSNLLLDECFVFSNQSPREG